MPSTLGRSTCACVVDTQPEGTGRERRTSGQGGKGKEPAWPRWRSLADEARSRSAASALSRSDLSRSSRSCVSTYEEGRVGLEGAMAQTLSLNFIPYMIG
jgi:hypothetical protein